MVEGPGCMIKGQKIKKNLLGKKINKVNHVRSMVSVAQTRSETKINVADSQTVSSNKSKVQKVFQLDQKLKHHFELLNGRTLNEVLTLGKELFMFFDELCLRIHFLMAGSFSINNKAIDTDAGRLAKDDKSILDIWFGSNVLSFYKSAAELRSSSLCLERFEEYKTLDICSIIFDSKRAVNLISKQTRRQLCDILLDQEILPGVGNIIKNESLFDSFLNPNATVDNISEKQISYLVKMTRDFSMLFYKCRSSGENLGKYYKVYGKQSCGQCKSKIICTRMGDDNERMTYFCEKCQDNDPSKQHMPMKNSLLGWMVDKSTPTHHWTCIHCTLINNYYNLFCDACGFQKAEKTSQSVSKNVRKRKSDFETASLSKKLCAVRDESKNVIESPDSVAKLKKVTVSKIPDCPGHQSKCLLREVRKDSPNKGRMFFVCSKGRGKECKYFKWADDDFPRCNGHNIPCVLRTVLKQGPNNGKKFFACSRSKKDQCKFFEWTENYN